MNVFTMFKLTDQIKLLYENKDEHITEQEAKDAEKRLMDFFMLLWKIDKEQKESK